MIANEKAPGDCYGRIGTVLQHKAETSDYQVQLDGDDRGPGWLASWQLESEAQAAERLHERA